MHDHCLLKYSAPPALAILAFRKKTACLAVSCAVVAMIFTSPLKGFEIVDFNRDIRPILSRNCAACHGPDDKKREAGLRLDVRDVAIALRDGHRAITPGDPQQSELVRRVSSDDPDERMPPPSTGKRLTAQEIDHLSRWIRQGRLTRRTGPTSSRSGRRRRRSAIVRGPGTTSTAFSWPAWKRRNFIRCRRPSATY